MKYGVVKMEEAATFYITLLHRQKIHTHTGQLYHTLPAMQGEFDMQFVTTTQASATAMVMCEAKLPGAYGCCS